MGRIMTAKKNKIGGKLGWFTGKRIVWLVGLGLVLFAGILFAVAFLGDKDEQQRRGGGETPVVIQPASPYLFADIIEAIGTARANESVTLTAQVSDTVKEVHFTDGGAVEAGTILITLNNAEELANVSSALAAYTEARQQFDRTKPLVDQGTLSQAALDAAIRAVNEATGRLDAARARAGDYIISAPFAGILGLRQVSPGTLVSPGTPVTTIDDISLIKLDFSVPERFLSTITPGQEIVASAAAYPSRIFRGAVTAIDSRVDPVTRAVTVRAELANPEALLRPGMLLTVDLVSNLKQSLSVPEKSIIPVSEEEFVFVVREDGTVERRSLEVGRRYGNRVEIISGLNAGDMVVTSGIMRLAPDMAVRVLREETPPGLPDYLLSFQAKEDEEEADVPF